MTQHLETLSFSPEKAQKWGFGMIFFVGMKIAGSLCCFRINGWVAGVRRGCYGINGTRGGKKGGAGVTLEPDKN